MSNKFLVGLYSDEDKMVDGVRKMRESHLEVYDVVTPFAVHGLDDALGLDESRLHITGFIYGLTGTTIALSFMIFFTGHSFFCWLFCIRIYADT